MSIQTEIQIAVLRKAYDCPDKDPVNRLPESGEYMDKSIPEYSPLEGQLAAVRSVLGDQGNNWYQLILDVFTNIDSGVRRAVFENFVINATVRHGEIHDKLTEQYDCNIPWAILMDSTSACNLHCTGCWAAA